MMKWRVLTLFYIRITQARYSIFLSMIVLSIIFFLPFLVSGGMNINS